METKLIDKFPSGIINIPPSKSAAHRAIICASLAEGDSRIENLASRKGLSRDINATLDCMCALGADCYYSNNMLVIRSARGRDSKFQGFDEAGEETPSVMHKLDCGESGSTLRFLIPVAALSEREVSLTGGGALMDRPLQPYIDALGENGVNVTLINRFLDVRGPMRPGIFRMPGDVSSQFISGLLLALPLLPGDSEIIITTPLESASYVEMTTNIMHTFGVTAEETAVGYRIRGRQRYTSRDFRVEGDYSQAAFFLAAGALGRDCSCAGLDPLSLQGDRRFIDILRKCGAEVRRERNGTILARPGKLTAIDVDVTDIPDLVPPLAALLCYCDGVSRITGAKRLRLKESDRLAAVASELGTLGAQIEEGEDTLTITGTGGGRLRGGTVRGHNDHRIAMMTAVAAIGCEEPVYLEGAECVAKSYPSFWQDWERGWTAR